MKKSLVIGVVSIAAPILAIGTFILKELPPLLVFLPMILISIGLICAIIGVWGRFEKSKLEHTLSIIGFCLNVLLIVAFLGMIVLFSILLYPVLVS